MCRPILRNYGILLMKVKTAAITSTTTTAVVEDELRKKRI
jgi:hypothetical protein